MSKNQRRTIIGLVVAIIVLIVIILFTHSNKSGTLQLSLNLPDYQNLSVKLNNQKLAVDQLQSQDSLTKGSYTLNISKPNYKNFSEQFTIASGQTVLINVNLVRSINTAVNSWSQIKSANILAPGATITQTVYFYQQTWAFLTIQLYGQQAFVVTKYDDSSSQWVAVLGPGTFFTSANVSSLPSDVVNYMNNNNYVAGG
jgi:hypothetical protein